MSSAPFVSPIAPPATAQNGGSSRLAQRVALAFALWVIWCTPLGFMASTAAKFGQIFKEFGLKLGAAEMLTLQIGSLISSPAGLLFMLVAFPALCFAAAALILPGRAALNLTAARSARWPLVIIAVVGSFLGAALLWVGYVTVMSRSMLPILEKLQQTPAAANTPPAAPAR